MAKLVMIGEHHKSAKLKEIGGIVKDKAKSVKPSKRILLVEGPFATPDERVELELDIPITPTGPILKFFNERKEEGLSIVTISDMEKPYLDERNLNDYDGEIEAIESPVLWYLPRALELGKLARINESEKKLLTNFKEILEVTVEAWKMAKAYECMVLQDYAKMIELSILIRENMNQYKGIIPEADLLRDGQEKILRVLSKLSPEVSDAVENFYSALRIIFRIRSEIQTKTILEAMKRDYELLITVTGGGYIPEIANILKPKKFEKEAIFIGESQEKYVKEVREIDPDVQVDDLSSN